MSKQLLDEILRLPIDQRLELVERVWDSIAASPESIPVPEWHKEVLDRRLGQDPEEPDVAWDELQIQLRDRK
jgi:putative addiction module component (TIGR02574 family)